MLFLWIQGFYVALRLVAACQLGKEPSLSVITLSDPPPRLMGVDSTTIAGFAQKKWTIEVLDRCTTPPIQLLHINQSKSLMEFA